MLTAILLALSGNPSAEAAMGLCNPNRTYYRTAVTLDSTTSAVFVPVPYSYLNIAVGGTNPSCVIVTFSASVRAFASTMYVRAYIPQLGEIAEPETVLFTVNSGGVYRTHSMQFVFPSIPPGQYTVQIQFRRGGSVASLVGVGERTLTVQYRH